MQILPPHFIGREIIERDRFGKVIVLWEDILLPWFLFIFFSSHEMMVHEKEAFVINIFEVAVGLGFHNFFDFSKGPLQSVATLNFKAVTFIIVIDSWYVGSN